MSTGSTVLTLHVLTPRRSSTAHFLWVTIRCGSDGKTASTLLLTGLQFKSQPLVDSMKHTAIVSLYAFALADLSQIESALRVVALLMPMLVGIVQMLRRPPRREPKPRRAPAVSRSVLPALACVALVGALTGCAPATTSSIVRALGADTNSVSVHVTTVWGTVDVRRNVPANQ